MNRLQARSLMLQLIALCTAFGVLFAPVAEAAECSDEADVVSLIEQHGEPGDEGSGPEKHGTCAHDHCHHGSQMVAQPAEGVTSPSTVSSITSRRYLALNSGIAKLATPPPRR